MEYHLFEQYLNCFLSKSLNFSTKKIIRTLTNYIFKMNVKLLCFIKMLYLKFWMP